MAGPANLMEPKATGARATPANGHAPDGGPPNLPTREPDPSGIPRWVLVVVGVALAALLVIAGLTLYVVSGLEVDAQRSRQELRVAKATQALVNVVAERQRHENVPAKIEAAQAETKAKLAGLQDQMTRIEGQLTDVQGQITHMQGQLTETQKLLVETKDTMDRLVAQIDALSVQAKQSTTALRAEISSKSAQAKDSAAALRSNVQTVQKTQKQLDALLHAVLKRLAVIQSRLP